MENKILSIQVKVSELKKVVQIAGGAVPGNAVVLAHECLHFEVKANKMLIVTGTDANLTIRNFAMCEEVEIIEDSFFMVPFKILSELLKTLPSVPITIEAFKDEMEKKHSSELQLYTYGINVLVDSQMYNIPGENPDEFPKAKFTKEKSFSIDVQQFREGIRHVMNHYVPNDDARPYMSGVRLDLTSELVEIVAVSTFGGAVFETKEKSQIVGGFTLPDRFVKFMNSSLKDSDEKPLMFSTSGNLIKVMSETFTAMTVLVEGNYPNYSKFKKTDFAFETDVNIEEWKVVLRRALLFSTDIGGVRHSFREDKLFLKSEDSTQNKASEQHIAISEEIEEFDINLKGAQLVSGLNTVSGAAKLGMDNMQMPIYVMPQNHGGSALYYFFTPMQFL